MDKDLGGGDHGYLGLYLSDVEYAQAIPIPTPFVASVCPNALAIDPDITAVDDVHAKEAHQE